MPRCGMHGASSVPVIPAEGFMDVWDRLERDLKAEGVFMGHRLQAALLKERYEAKMASAEFDEKGHIIGFLAFWPTAWSGVVEMGTFWVKFECRGKVPGRRQISETIIADCTAKLKAANLRGIMVVGNQRAEQLALACGWQVDAHGDCQALRWALSGTDRPRSSGSTQTSARTALVFFPE